VILGAQKCGTSSLHNYLVQHPRVIAPLLKEVHYFDVNYTEGEAWYRSHFGRVDEPGLNIDSSPYYLFHPAVPKRLKSLLPDARLIVMFRDPVRRAYSHYWHQRDEGREQLSFEEAIRAEPERLGDAEAQLLRGTITQSREHRLFSYLARGRYAEQMERWLALFPREQFHCVLFEDFVRRPLESLNAAFSFLGLEPLSSAQLEARNTRRYPPMNEETAARLHEYFRPHNARLESQLGIPVGGTWDVEKVGSG
jgi:hypothetical protein